MTVLNIFTIIIKQLTQAGIWLQLKYNLIINHFVDNFISNS